MKTLIKSILATLVLASVTSVGYAATCAQPMQEPVSNQIHDEIADAFIGESY